MPHKHEPGRFSVSQLTYGPAEKVNQLLELGVIDAQALNFGNVQRLTSKLGVSEIERAREEAKRISEETGHTPDLYGRQIVEVVRVARAAHSRRSDEVLAQKVEAERDRLYARMAQSAGSVAVKEAQLV